MIGTDRYQRPRDLPDQWLVDRVRLLAVQPQPPEVAPGTEVTFDALIADPNGEVGTVVWAACPPSGAGSFGCEFDLSEISDEPTPEELEEAGVIGIEPFTEPVYTPPEDLLDGLSEAEATEGLNVTVQVAAFPPFDELQDTANIDFNEIEVGFKRLVVSEAPTPNHNPTIEHVVFGGEPLRPTDAAGVEAGLEYSVGVRLGPDAVEDYQYLNSDGELEDRVEEPYLTLYATGGEMFEQYDLYEPGQAEPVLAGRWVAPESGTRGNLYLVVRDRRGGMAWAVQPFRVR